MRTSLDFLRRAIGIAAVVFVALTTTLPVVGATGASAQYGGISALFVSTSPDRPGMADFSGLGCNGGQEVILYWPGLPATAQDPVGSQSVPGRILAVTQSTLSDDPLLNGTFTFPNVTLPDVAPGVYEVHSRCGDLDLTVLIQISDDGFITINPDPTTPATNGTPSTITNDGPGGPSGPSGPNGPLPFTGRESSRIVSLGAGFLAAGLAVLALSRRQQVA